MVWPGGGEGRDKGKKVPWGGHAFDFKQLRTIIKHKKKYHVPLYIWKKQEEPHDTNHFFYNNSFAKTRAIPNAEKYDETLGISSLRG